MKKILVMAATAALFSCGGQTPQAQLQMDSLELLTTQMETLQSAPVVNEDSLAILQVQYDALLARTQSAALSEHQRNLLDKIEDRYELLKEKVSEEYNEGLDKIEGVSEGVSNAAEGTYESAKEKAHEISERAHEVTEGIKETGRETKEKVDKLKDAVNDLKN